MKKEKNSVSPSQVKPGLPLKEEPGSGSPPAIKSDPDAGVNGENSNNNCDNSTPGTPGSGGQGEPPDGGHRDTPGSIEDKKPVIGSGGTSSGPPSNCNTGNGLIKSETDPFLDTFDSKDGGKTIIVYSFLLCEKTSSKSTAENKYFLVFLLWKQFLGDLQDIFSITRNLFGAEAFSKSSIFI